MFARRTVPHIFSVLGNAVLILSLLMAMAAFPASVRADEEYKMFDLGTLGGSYTQPYAINEAGQVIGDSYTAGDAESHGFIWNNGTMTGLGTFGGNFSHAVAINEAGQVIGNARTAGAETHAFVWQAGVMTDLGTLGGSTSTVFAINEAGQIIGDSITDEGETHAFLWSGGVMTDLGTLGGSSSQVIAINEAGQVIGNSAIAGDTEGHAFLWSNGVMTDLGTLGGPSSTAIAFNEAGQVIGNSQTAVSSPHHAFIWDDGVMTDLDAFGEGYSEARAINEAGQVVGNATNNHAFLWEDGVTTDLGTLGGSTSWAISINEAGQVVGNSLTTINVSHVFVWEDGVMTNLGSFGSISEAMAINEAGEAVGFINTTGNPHAFVWSGGVMNDLGTLGGSNSAAVAINEAGQVIGQSDITDDLGSHGFVAMVTDASPLTVTADAQSKVYGDPDPSFTFTYSGFVNGDDAADIDTAPTCDVIVAHSNVGTYPIVCSGGADDGYIFTYVAGTLTVMPPDLTGAYTLTDLGTLGGNFSRATAINEASQVIGYSPIAGDSEQHAFLWDEGVMTDLGTLGGTHSRATAINEAGQVIGYSHIAGDSEQHAFLWDGGVMTDLILGGTHSRATAINEAGQVIGDSFIAGDSEQHAFLWDGGVMTDLGTLGGPYSYATAINEAGQVIGNAWTLGDEQNDSQEHAFLWDDGVMIDLGTLGNYSHAYAINEAGQVIGVSQPVGMFQHGFIWENGVMTDLGIVEPHAINEAGQVIGRYNDMSGYSHAFLWENGVLTDLGTLGGDYSDVIAINEEGQVIGYSDTAGNQTHAFIWEDGVMTDLGTLGGNYSLAIAINEAGQVLGRSYTIGTILHAFVWEDGVMTDLGTLDGDTSEPVAINEAGQVIGNSSAVGNTELHAFLATATTTTSLTVTADAQSKVYGDPDPSFTFTYSGFVNGDDETDIDTPPACTVSDPHTDVGSYPIVCSGGIDNDYTFNYVAGTLTVLSNVPDLLTPANAEHLLNNRPTFDWTDVSGAISYTIQISNNIGFTGSPISNTVTDSTYTQPTNLPNNVTRYWRVQAIRDSGPGPWSVIRSFVTASPPSVPGLASPGNNSLSTDYTPLLDWNNSTVPAGTTFLKYELQLATDNAFTSPTSIDVAAPVTNSSYTPGTDLDSNTTYYWRVRSYNTLGQYSAWSAVRSFRTALLPPTLVTPNNGEQMSVNRPTFEWDDVAGAADYRIQISNNIGFTSTLTNATVTSSTYTRTSDLPFGVTLYWRVRSNGTNGPSAWSEVRSLVTTNSPSAPTLVSPANNAKVSGPSPLFDWNDPTVPAGVVFSHYEIQFALSNDFTTIIGAAMGSSSQFDDTAIFLPATTYYWRVRAYNSLGHVSAWSTVRSVKIIFAEPALNLPASGSTVGGLRPTFTWDAVSGAADYTIQVSKSNTFSPLVINKTVTSATYPHTANLQAGTTYYWRVRVKSPTTYGPGDWSQVYTFTTP